MTEFIDWNEGADGNWYYKRIREIPMSRYAFYNPKTRLLRVAVQDPAGCVVKLPPELGYWAEAYIRAVGIPATIQFVEEFTNEIWIGKLW